MDKQYKPNEFAKLINVYSRLSLRGHLVAGLNYNRKKWNDLLAMCRNREVKQILVAHKDRFIRLAIVGLMNF